MEKLFTMRTLFLFSAIFVLSVALRSWKLSAPIADWHSFRQADTASVAQVFVQKGIDMLHPRYHDLSNIQSGKENPEGWRMVEFPLYQGIAAWLFGILPFISLDMYLRLITAISSSLTGLMLGIMVLRRSTWFAGLMTFVLYSILPYSIFYGRVVLPDPFMVFLSVAALFMLDVPKISWMHTGISALLAALAILVKPQAVFLLLPALSLFVKRPFSGKQMVKLVLWGVVALIPILLWRKWILQFPEGIPVFDWLFNKNDIRFKGAWFYWLFADRIGRLMLGYWGLIPFGFGLVAKAKRGTVFFWLFGLGTLGYMSVIAGGNVQHDYYQILLLPTIAMFLGLGFSYLCEGHDEGRSLWTSRGMALVSLIFLCSFSWYFVRSYYWINRPEIVEAGKAADAMLPKDAKVIAPYNGDTAFLYQTKRIGWPQGFEIEDKIQKGASYYVTVDPSDANGETKDLAERYTVLIRNEKFAIIDLTRKK